MSAARGGGAEILQTLEVIIKPFHLRMSGVEVLSRAEPQTRRILKRITQAAELCSYCSDPGKRWWWLGLAGGGDKWLDHYTLADKQSQQVFLTDRIKKRTERKEKEEDLDDKLWNG